MLGLIGLKNDVSNLCFSLIQFILILKQHKWNNALNSSAWPMIYCLYTWCVVYELEIIHVGLRDNSIWVGNHYMHDQLIQEWRKLIFCKPNLVEWCVINNPRKFNFSCSIIWTPLQLILYHHYKPAKWKKLRTFWLFNQKSFFYWNF